MPTWSDWWTYGSAMPNVSSIITILWRKTIAIVNHTRETFIFELSDVNEKEKKNLCWQLISVVVILFSPSVIYIFVYTVRVRCETNNKRERPYVKITSNDTSLEQLAALYGWYDVSCARRVRYGGIYSIASALYMTKLYHDMDGSDVGTCAFAI